MIELLRLLEEALSVDEAIGVKKRVRDGGKKVQRRFRFSKLKSQSFNNKTKKKKTLTASDRMKLSRIQKIAAKKRMAKRGMSNLKRAKSNRKRKNLGFDK